MDQLEHGRACYERRAWSDAYHALSCADASGALGEDDLDRLATAAYLTGRETEFLRLVERLYRAHLASGASARAARCTFWLSITYLLSGERARSNAWLARGERLVDDGDSLEGGYLAVVTATQQLHDGDAEAAHATASRAADIGTSSEDADLVAAARTRAPATRAGADQGCIHVDSPADGCHERPYVSREPAAGLSRDRPRKR